MGHEFRSGGPQRPRQDITPPRGSDRAIYLYVPFAPQDAFRPAPRPPWRRTRNAARRAVDVAQWRLLGRAPAHYSAWEDVANSNVGDAAMASALGQLVRAAGWSAAETVPVGWGTLDDARIERINRDGLCVLVAGGYFVVRQDGSLSRRADEDYALLRKLKRPLIPAGLGVNLLLSPDGAPPAISPQASETMRKWLALCGPIGLRDQGSIRLAAGLGFRAELTPDPVLVMSPKPTQTTPARRKRPAIGVNLAFHGRRDGLPLNDLVAAYVSMLRRLRAELGAEVRYFVHSDSERFIVRTLQASGVVDRVLRGPADALIEAYAELDVHVAQMMHSSILSVCAGTPVCVVAYDQKNLEFCKLVGLEPHAIQEAAVTPGALLERVRGLYRQRDAVAATLRRARERLRAQQLAFLGAALEASAEPAAL